MMFSLASVADGYLIGSNESFMSPVRLVHNEPLQEPLWRLIRIFYWNTSPVSYFTWIKSPKLTAGMFKVEQSYSNFGETV